MVGGVRVFRLETSVIRWNILSDERVHAYAFNRQVPGPRIELIEGDRVRLIVSNGLPEPTTVHWHGLVVPNAMDGPAEITQEPIQPGDSYTYEYTVRQAGTFMYHTHDHPDRQQALGLYGALIVKPQDAARDERLRYQHDVVVQLQEWLEREGFTYPAMLMEGGLPNFFTINGKAYPDTEPIRMRIGERRPHPLHRHETTTSSTQCTSTAVPSRSSKATAIQSQREHACSRTPSTSVRANAYDVIWTARLPGKWLLHCHIPHHTTNENVEEKGGGGLTTVIDVDA